MSPYQVYVSVARRTCSISIVGIVEGKFKDHSEHFTIHSIDCVCVSTFSNLSKRTVNLIMS